ncbi:TetR/AcrR family transcriptional regulator [Amycolatopsis sp. EV170708-02-1]|uniref:TetR/AcrR family transcriptional regulator n=1 Tax=Amycolatopsis sp. EV170708-02-1 TaxID=2919322 RepID=UPI001F0C4F16|nr:TetR/AcrR family transcriptional regulator [Amycolatopsis sp. EV170708-02-1]UMP05543.1 TetR/AcrR family transcriptional regulator [Amycolatopsis sp. EV170708-02-1]
MSTRNGPRKAEEIFAATLGLLAEHGYDKLAIEAVAARSGVNKTTLYRWWPSKDALLAAALRDSGLFAVDIPDTGSLRGDLLAVATQIHRLLTSKRTAPVVTATLTAGPRRPELGDVARSFFADRMAREEPIFDRAIARGELRDGVDPVLVMDLLAGAIWFRSLLRGGEADAKFLEQVVDTVLGGAA